MLLNKLGVSVYINISRKFTILKVCVNIKTPDRRRPFIFIYKIADMIAPALYILHHRIHLGLKIMLEITHVLFKFFRIKFKIKVQIMIVEIGKNIFVL